MDEYRKFRLCVSTICEHHLPAPPRAGTELNMIGFLDFHEYITHGTVDIVRPFGDYIGGITPVQKAHICARPSI